MIRDICLLYIFPRIPFNKFSHQYSYVQTSITRSIQINFHIASSCNSIHSSSAPLWPSYIASSQPHRPQQVCSTLPSHFPELTSLRIRYRLPHLRRCGLHRGTRQLHRNRRATIRLGSQMLSRFVQSSITCVQEHCVQSAVYGVSVL
jgi:hypothetical protein